MSNIMTNHKNGKMDVGGSINEKIDKVVVESLKELLEKNWVDFNNFIDDEMKAILPEEFKNNLIDKSGNYITEEEMYKRFDKYKSKIYE